MPAGEGCSCLGAATSRVAWIDDAVERAVQLARLAPGGRAIAAAVEPVELPADPAASFAAAAAERTLLVDGGGWLLGEGTAAEAVAAGPDRFARLARQHAALAALTVVAAPRGGGEHLRWLLAATCADAAPAPGEWGAALPAARLRLPARLHLRLADGRGFRIRAVQVDAAEDPGAAAARLAAAPPARVPAPAAAWTATADGYAERVEEAVDLIRDMALKKVVLARAEDRDLPAADDGERLRRLRERLGEPAADGDARTLYWIDLDHGGAFAGVTPELLLAGCGGAVRTMALAGTGRAAAMPALLDATKERKEHGLVVEHLVAALRRRCAPFAVPGAPHVRRIGDIIHLETLLSAELPAASRGDWLDLVAALHPTPAVVGLPVATAAHWLRRREGLERGLYAGVIGWIAADACRCIVPLRGAVLDPDRRRARLYAGAGIVESSDGPAELAETALKMGPMREVLGI